MISEEQDGFGATKGVFYIYVKNADESFARALSYGATKIMEPMDMPYEDRQGGVTDPFGNQWWISTRLVEEPYD
jgi:PhnB protein